jgi:transcriptional regulator with XRE-family HTH domain
LALARAIRVARKDRNLSQTDLGERAGVHPTWISHIESGRVNPTAHNLALLSEGLGMKLSDLIRMAEELTK